MSSLFVLFALLCLVETQKQNNLVLLGQLNNQKLDLKCATSEIDKAIIWNTAISPEFIPTEPQYPDFERLQLSVTTELSIKTNFGPTLDERWEGLTTKYTNTPNKADLEFVKLDGINSFYKTFIPISVRLKAEGHIYICKNKNDEPPQNDCYWIILSGFSGTKSVIRKCLRGQIEKTNVGPSGSCSKNHAENTSKKLNENEWKHFTVSLNRDTKSISVVFEGDKTPFLHYEDKNFVDDVGEVFVNSRLDHGGFWKLHNYQVYVIRDRKTNEYHWVSYILPHQTSVCLTMYVAICDKCTAILSLNGSTATTEKNYPKEKGSTWQKIVFSAINLVDRYYSLYIKIEGELKNTDNIVISHVMQHQSNNCFENALKYSILNIKETYRYNVSCQFLMKDTMNKEAGIVKIEAPTLLSENLCGPESVGSVCLSCLSLYKKPICERTIVCEKNSCYCSQGFEGRLCQSACELNYYGIGCKESCGKCIYICNNVDGYCPHNSCEENFQGTHCKDAKLPVLLKAPEVMLPCITECKIKFDPDHYTGSIAPIFYKIQYKDSNQWNWVTTDQISIIKPHYVLTGLTKLTNYTLRIYLITGDGKQYDKDSIPTFSFTTSCKNISINNINITSTNTSAQIIVMADYENEGCHLKNYNLIVSDPRRQTIYINQLQCKNPIKSLKPWTTYNVSIYNEMYTLFTSFKTDEGTPGIVENIVYNSTDITISLEWGPPLETNGNILEYIVTYQHTLYNSCPHQVSDSDSYSTYKITNTKLVLKNLNPDSNYTVWIGASTKYQGQMVKRQISTNPSDELDKNAYKITTTEGIKKIELKFEPNCKNIKGPVFVGITLTCSQYWCNETSNVTVNPYHLIYNLLHLHAYTEYHMKFILFNSNKSIDLSPKTVTTAPGVPNPVTNFEVYEKSESSVSMRWNPPEPPTGVIEKYIISSQYGYWLKYAGTTNTVFTCKVWTDMMCAELKGLSKGWTYRMTIVAKNKNVNQKSKGITTDAKVEVTSPESPKICMATWDDGFNFTLRWEHPNKTNGKLLYFTILRNDIKFFQYNVQEYNLTYEITQVMYPDTPTYNFGIVAINAAGSSNINRRMVDNPPKPPELKEQFISIKEMTNSTITIGIPTPMDNLYKSFTYIIISDPESVDCNNSKYVSHFIKDYKGCVWFAKEIRTQEKEEEIVIGDMSLQQSDFNETITNHVLQPNTSYTIFIVVVNEMNLFKRFNVYKVQESTTEGTKVVKPPLNPPENSAIYAWLILLILPILLYIYLRKKKVRFAGCVTKTGNESRADTIPLTKKQESKRSNDNSINFKKPAVAPTPSKFSKLINLNQFEAYVKDSISNGELSRQHALFPRGEQKPNDYGKLPQNKSKNRYMNLVAYNHSRVQLKKINDDEFSDYINASYINGYKIPNAYIATQGPKPTTVNDFWRMIWEENVHYIVMLANVMENGKKKTEKYWPEYNKTLDFDSINVQHISSEIYADYEYRIFTVKRENEEKKVEQVHFTTWPDHGVPLYPQSLVPFLRKLLTFSYTRTSPIVIHCSAGVGRTGTIILIDLCLRMAANTGSLDPLHCLHELREQRANMVDNVEQYKLAHLVILECLLAPDTSIPCNENFEAAAQSVVENEVMKQMAYIKRSAWQEDAIALTKPKLMNNQPDKNRFQDILPENYGIMYLPAVAGDESSNYINAVTVDGFKSPKRFLATQQPLPNTISDFWRLVVEDDVSIIISLQEIDKNDPTCCEFWPTKKIKKMNPIPQITLQHVQTEVSEHYNTVSIILNIKDEQRRISVIVLKNWAYGKMCPETVTTLLAAWQQMNKLLWNENRIVVTCRDGATGCGLYITMCFLLEKIKLEQICDVCHSVRVIRRSRRQFVESEEQFTLLYEIAKLYLTEFELYSNFSTSK